MYIYVRVCACVRPWAGKVQFSDVTLRYRPGLPLALDGLSFTVPAGKRCGVVGRTGSGKSTIISALFRLVEPSGGQVEIDGIDLSGLGLRDVRRRMVCIPQDPVLFSGSLRHCLDPFRQHDDDRLWETLDVVGLAAGLRSASKAAKGAGLDTPVCEGGSNWSVGERQLLSMARALLGQPRVLVLDEATASIDGETDARIQRMLRELPRLRETTVLSVAHRLQTVMDFDLILVLEAGRAVEFGSPSALLANDEGYFHHLVECTGPENAAALRALAEEGPGGCKEATAGAGGRVLCA